MEKYALSTSKEALFFDLKHGNNVELFTYRFNAEEARQHPWMKIYKVTIEES